MPVQSTQTRQAPFIIAKSNLQQKEDYSFISDSGTDESRFFHPDPSVYLLKLTQKVLVLTILRRFKK